MMLIGILAQSCRWGYHLKHSNCSKLLMISSYEEIDSATQALIVENMPPSGRTLIRSLGLVAALRLIDSYGGKVVEIRLDDASLVKTVGTENIKYLIAMSRPSGKLYIPLYRSVKRVSCNKEIIPLYEELIETMSGRDAVGTLAAKYNMAQRTIENVVNHYYESRQKYAIPKTVR